MDTAIAAGEVHLLGEVPTPGGQAVVFDSVWELSPRHEACDETAGRAFPEPARPESRP